MSREIKFRAWLVKEKTMVSVSHMQLKQPRYITTRRKAGGIFFRGTYNLMQYTGTKDKAGKEIYEGDIITHSNDGMKGVVTWSPGLYGFVIENLQQIEIIADLCDYDFEPEVLGNIYENPELLKGEN